MITRDRIVQTFLDLAVIDSPSGFEDDVAAELVARLAAIGVEASQDVHGNVIGRLAGDGEPVLLSAHMDTVEPGRGIAPQWDGDDVLRSDGTTILGADDKAGCAIIIEVIQSLLEDAVPRRTIEVAITRGEEIGLVGAQNLDYSRLTARVAIVIDSGGPPSSIQGQAPYHYTYDIEVHGRSAHAGLEPEKGVPAISIAAEIITGLPQGRLDEETTGNIGTIRGGLVRNAVPDYTLIQGELRSMVDEKAETLLNRVRRRVEDARDAHPQARIETNIGGYEGYTLDDDDPAVRLLYPVLRSMGFEPDPRPIGGGTDGNIFRQHGIASVVVGRGGYNQHTKDEYLVISEMLDCARVVEACLKL